MVTTYEHCVCNFCIYNNDDRSSENEISFCGRVPNLYNIIYYNKILHLTCLFQSIPIYIVVFAFDT